MGLLDGMMGGGQNPFEQYQAMQANPFTQQIPGMEYLSGMGNPMQQGGQLPGGFNPQEQGMPQPGLQEGVPTDFAGVPPGLPNLPQDMQGFGFGEGAPQMNINTNLRQDLISQLLQQLMQGGMGGMQQGMPQMGQGMGNMGPMDQGGF